MSSLSTLRRLCLAAAIPVLIGGAALASGPQDGLFQAAKTVHDTVPENESPDARKARYESVRQILDQIVMIYPDSDLAARIAAGETVGGVDIAAIDAELGRGPARTGAPTAQESTDTETRPASKTEPQTPTAENPFDTPAGKTTPPGGAQSGGAQDRPATDPFAATTSTSPTVNPDPFATPQAGEKDTAMAPPGKTANPADAQNPFGAGSGQADGGQTDSPNADPFSNDGGVPIPGFDRTAGPADQFSDMGLQLSRAEKREIQIRLRLLGHDPKGADGVFGANSRTAIAGWQQANDILSNGWLNREQIDMLKAQSQIAYAAHLKSAPKRTTRKKRRVKICSASVLGVRVCRYEYR